MGVKGKIKRALIVVILAVLAIVTIFPRNHNFIES